MAKLYLKWTVLVWANAIIGLILGGSIEDMTHNIGIFLGVCVFIPLYVLLDNHAIKTGNTRLQKSLLIGVIIRACTQVIVVVDMMVGLMASMIVERWFGLETIRGYDIQGFWHGFLLTVVTGVILSGVAGVLTMESLLFMNVMDKGSKITNQTPQLSP